MLEDSLFASRPSARSKKPATLVLSVIVHGVLAGGLIVIPLFQTQLLPQIPLFEPLHPPTAPASRGPIELVPVPRAASAASTEKPPELAALIAPVRIPNKIFYGEEPPATPTGFVSGIPGANGGLGTPGGVNFGLPSGAAVPPPLPPPPAPAPPTPPPAVAEPAPTTLIRKGGDVVQSNLIHTVKPEYPRLAIASHTQGAVILEAVITREGTIDGSRLRVLTGSPLLTSAAVEAVKQWRYRPTTLNGAPVEVLTTITVNFSLN